MSVCSGVFGGVRGVFGELHLENERKLRGICFIDPEDTEFKETIKNARKKFETSVSSCYAL